MAFTSKFFSLSGQKERLSNVGKYLQLGASKITAGVIPAPKSTDANFKAKGAVGSIAQAVVNNPKTAALVATGAAYAGKAIAAKAPSISAGISKAAQSAKAKVTGNKPGMLKPAAQNAGGLLTPTPASPVPVAPNAGMITPSSPSAPRTTSARRTRRTRKKGATKRTRRTKRSTKKRSTKKRYGTAKQYARPGGKKVYYAKNGTPYIKLANGKARFVKGKRK